MGALPSFASSGAATVSSATMAASGLPGSPTRKRPSGSSASTVGWPGRMAMLLMWKVPPMASTARRRKSAVELPVAPVVITTSAGSSGESSRAASMASRLSAARSRPTTEPPKRSTTCGSCGEKASRTYPGSGMPEATTSSPVSTSLTCGLPKTRSSSAPPRAAREMWAGLSVVPALIKTSPSAASCATGRMCWPFLGSPGRESGPSTKTGRPSSSFLTWPDSLRSTALAPAGMGPPVTMGTACPAASRGPVRQKSRAGCPPLPSRPWRRRRSAAWGGRPDKSAASVRPMASANGTGWAGSASGSAWASALASSQVCGRMRAGSVGVEAMRLLFSCCVGSRLRPFRRCQGLGQPQGRLHGRCLIHLPGPRCQAGRQARHKGGQRRRRADNRVGCHAGKVQHGMQCPPQCRQFQTPPEAWPSTPAESRPGFPTASSFLPGRRAQSMPWLRASSHVSMSAVVPAGTAHSLMFTLAMSERTEAFARRCDARAASTAACKFPHGVDAGQRLQPSVVHGHHALPGGTDCPPRAGSGPPLPPRACRRQEPGPGHRTPRQGCQTRRNPRRGAGKGRILLDGHHAPAQFRRAQPGSNALHGPDDGDARRGAGPPAVPAGWEASGPASCTAMACTAASTVRASSVLPSGQEPRLGHAAEAPGEPAGQNHCLHGCGSKVSIGLMLPRAQEDICGPGCANAACATAGTGLKQ